MLSNQKSFFRHYKSYVFGGSPEKSAIVALPLMVNTSNVGLSPVSYNAFTSSFESITFCFNSMLSVNSTSPAILNHTNSGVAVTISQFGFASSSFYVGLLFAVQKYGFPSSQEQNSIGLTFAFPSSPLVAKYIKEFSFKKLITSLTFYIS